MDRLRRTQLILGRCHVALCQLRTEHRFLLNWLPPIYYLSLRFLGSIHGLIHRLIHRFICSQRSLALSLALLATSLILPPAFGNQTSRKKSEAPPHSASPSQSSKKIKRAKKIFKPVELKNLELGHAAVQTDLRNFLKSDQRLVASKDHLAYSKAEDPPLIFDFPVTYNAQVQRWIQFFQGPGRKWYRTWLERSSRYLPSIQKILARDGLPLDLAFIAMIESGYSSNAESTASAVGPWQFIRPTGNRYGLRTSWWIDERRDFDKSTKAAAQYLSDLYKMFNSWYLVAAGYNTGENRIRRLLKKYNTTDYWELVRRKAIPAETREYVPKLIAAMLIAKAPGLYGFRSLNFHEPMEYNYFYAPGGTDLSHLAKYLKVRPSDLKKMNPELIVGLVPRDVTSHRIRIPQGSLPMVAKYLKEKIKTTASN